MGKQAKVKEATNIPSGGPLPGEGLDANGVERPTGTDAGEDPANDGTGRQVTQALTSPVEGPPVPNFKPVPLADSTYQRGFQRFEHVGDTFMGWFVRCISKNGDDAVGKYDAIEMERYPDGSSTLLPGTQQLWEFFNDVVAEDAERSRNLFSVTLTERVMQKDDPSKVHFLRFALGEEARPDFLRK